MKKRGFILECLFAGGHIDLEHGYTIYRKPKTATEDIAYWGLCAYCGHRTQQYTMNREIFDRNIARWHQFRYKVRGKIIYDWTEVDE